MAPYMIGRSAEGARRKEVERGEGGGKMGYVVFMGCRTVPKGKKGGKGKPRDVVFRRLGLLSLLLLKGKVEEKFGLGV